MDKQELLMKRIPVDEVKVLDGAATLTVRGLSRLQVAEYQDIDGVAAREIRLLELGLVAPTLSAEEAAVLYGHWTAGDLQPVIDKILDLSGMGESSTKDATKSAGDES